MEKIKMTTPLVEMDGDEMTRILWSDIKELLLTPYIDLNTVYFDLGLPERERTHDQVTVASVSTGQSKTSRSVFPGRSSSGTSVQRVRGLEAARAAMGSSRSASSARNFFNVS